MFPSISRCAPGSIVKSEFIAQFSCSISISGAIALQVNGSSRGSSANVSIGSRVTAFVQSPANESDSLFISYSVNGRSSTFAVVNRGPRVTTFSDGSDDKRWWDFSAPNQHYITYRSNGGKATILRDFGYNAIEVLKGFNAVADPFTISVYFYDSHGRLIENLEMPSQPVHTAKYLTEDECFFLICCLDGYVYKVTLDLEIIKERYLQGTDDYYQRVRTPIDWIFALSFEVDIPFKGSIIDANRYGGAGNGYVYAQPKFVSTFGNRIWVTDNGKVWILDSQFNIIAEQALGGTPAGIQAVEGGAVVTTRQGGIYKVGLYETIVDEAVRIETDIILLYSGYAWISNPTMFSKYVAVVDGMESKILLFDPTDNYNVSTAGLSDGLYASYISGNEERLFIAAHDTNVVQVYDGVTVTEASFLDKVTWVQAIDDGVIASHYLRDIDVMDHTGHTSIIPFTFPLMRSGLAHVGTIPQRVIRLGEANMQAIVPPGVTYWADGVASGLINTGTMFSVSSKIDSLGFTAFPVIIGDVAMDMFVYADNQTFVPKDPEIPLLTTKNGLAQYDFMVPEKYQPMRASIEYGYLMRNFNKYTGELINSGDVMSICIPFGNSETRIVSVVALGAANFYAAVNSGVPAQSLELTDCLLDSGTSQSVTIDVDGQYYIPQYYDVSASVDLDIFGTTLHNLGGTFDKDYPILRSDVLRNPSDPNYGTRSRVRSEDGLFDIYIDIKSPQVITSYSFMPLWESVTTQVPRLDSNGNPILDQNGNPTFTSSTRWFANEAPVNFLVEASNDAEDWAFIAEFIDVSASGWARITQRKFEFENEGAYRYWRFRNITTQGTGVSILTWSLTVQRTKSLVLVNGLPATVGINDLVVDDVLTIEMANSTRIYDTRNIKITGPVHIDVSTRTTSFEVMDYLMLETLVEPYVRMSYDYGPFAISGISKSAKLVGPDSLVVFDANDSEKFLPIVTVVNGDSVIIRKTVRNLYEVPTKIYQLQVDTRFDNCDVLVEVGKIVIENMQTTGAEIEPPPSIIDITPLPNTHQIGSDLATSSAMPSKTIQNGLSYFTSDAIDPVVVTGAESHAADNFDSNIQGGNYHAKANAYAVKRQTPAPGGTAAHLQFIIASLVEAFSAALRPELHVDATSKIDGLPISQVIDVENMRLTKATVYIKRNDDKFYFVNTIKTKQDKTSDYKRTVLPPIQHRTSFPIRRTLSSFIEHERQSVVDHMDYPIVSSAEKDLGVYTPYIMIDSIEVLETYVSLITTAVDMDFDAFNFYVLQPDSTTSPVGDMGTGTFNTMLSQGFTVLATFDETMVENVGSYFPEHQQLYLFNGFNSITLDEVIWTSDDIERYGAFNTEQEAIAAAAEKRHEPIMVFQIDGTDSYTYRRLSNLERVCSIIPFGQIYVLERLMQGG